MYSTIYELRPSVRAKRCDLNKQIRALSKLFDLILGKLEHFHQQVDSLRVIALEQVESR